MRTTIASTTWAAVLLVGTWGCGANKPADAQAPYGGAANAQFGAAPGQPGAQPAPPYGGAQPAPYGGAQPAPYGGAQPAPYGGAQPAPYGGAPAPGAPSPAAPGAPAAPTDLAGMIGGMMAQGAAAIGSMGGGAPGTDPVALGIKATAQQAAPGMKPEGQITKMTLSPGAHGQANVTLQPNKCYAFVAFGMLGVQQIALHLGAPPSPIPGMPSAIPPQEGVSNGATAVVGGPSQCVRNPLPMAVPAQIDVEMKAGQGQVGVQAYSK